MFAPFLFALLLTSEPTLDPCACDTPSFDLASKSSTVIFSGKLTKTGSIENGNQQLYFEPSNYWKGLAATRQTIVYRNPFSCATTVFVVGKDYLVYAQGSNPPIVNHCSRTRLLVQADDDIALLKQELGAPLPPRDPFVSMKGDRPRTLRPVTRVPRTLTVHFAVIVAISRKGNEYFTVLKGSDGKTYTMKEGNAVYDGRIERIGPNTVTFVQKSGTRTVRITKKLHPFSE